MGKGTLKHHVILPTAALNATDHHAFGDKFSFDDNEANAPAEPQNLKHHVILPTAALNATDHHAFGDKFSFDGDGADAPAEPQNLKHHVTLPTAALNATDHHAFGDKFSFDGDGANAATNAVSQPLDHVADQGSVHVPADVPPEGLPTEAGNMSDTAAAQLHAHMDGLLS